MKSEVKDVNVLRVANGWIVRPINNAEYGIGRLEDTHVARTPGELAQLLTDWALEQEKRNADRT